MATMEDSIDRAPVAQEDLHWLPRAGHGLHVPVGCLDCSELSVHEAAREAGAPTLKASLGGEPLTMVVPGYETKVIQVLDIRAQNAGSGACKFATTQPGCWRRNDESGQTE
jgi:hypothetical protein